MRWGARAGGASEKAAMQRLFNRFTGAVFVGFGAILLKSKPA
jgi:threonine/homoserine/homoserine lactone efflux protein